MRLALLIGVLFVGCGSSSSSDSSNGGGTSGAGGSVATGGSWASGGTSSGGAPPGGSGGAPLSCDPRFSFAPSPPVQAGAPFVAKFSDSAGYVYVDLKVTGPGAPSAAFQGVAQNGSAFTWTYAVSGHGAGVLAFEFQKDADPGPGTTVATCQIESQPASGTGGAPSGGGGAPSGGGTTGNFVASCPTSCPASGPSSYPSVATVGPPTTDHPPPLHGDLNIKNRGWEPCAKVGCGANGAVIGFVYYPPDPTGTDPKAPKLHTLFTPPAQPFTANYRMYDWDWSCGKDGCKGGLVTGAWEVTAVTMKTVPGEVLKLPQSGYEIAVGGFQARALYVDGDSVTLKYTGEDNVVVGYALSIVGVCPAPALRAKYEADDAAGRAQLPALHAGDVIGTACAAETLVTIRDSGSFMDPRSETDWWQGHP